MDINTQAQPAAPAAPADPMAAGAPEVETDDGGYTICIKVAGDGTLSVGVENERGEAPESAEGPEGADGSPQDPTENEDAEMSAYKPASSIKEALTIALEAYKADGKMADGGDDSDFTSGFGARGQSTLA